MEKDDRRFAFVIGLVLVAAASLATWLGYAAAGPDHVYGGLLLNPQDGYTYLAKAYQGWEGDWRFRLPYTAEPGAGAYLNLYYLFIGHAARILHLPVVGAYNLARILGTAFLAAALWRFYQTQLPAGRPRRTAFAIGALGLGMGWVVLPAGITPADFWVAEAYPYLSALTNPHFPMALALILVLAAPRSGRQELTTYLLDAVLAFLLALVSPFAVIVAALPWIGDEVLGQVRAGRTAGFDFRKILGGENLRHAAAILVGGAPVLIYDLAAIRADPILAGWDAQNIAVSPAWWDLLLSLSPALLLVFPALRSAPRRLLGWLLLGLLLVALPFSLQRRFLMALYIPLAGLAAVGLESFRPFRRRWATVVAALCILPGSLLILLVLRSGMAAHSELLYFAPAERAAFTWIEANTGPDDLVLAAPETGLFLPAFTGRAVIYGHPFETVNGEAEKAAVEAFFAPANSSHALAFLRARGVDWLFYGPREAALGPLPPDLPLEPGFEEGPVRVFRVLP